MTILNTRITGMQLQYVSIINKLQYESFASVCSVVGRLLTRSFFSTSPKCF